MSQINQFKKGVLELCSLYLLAKNDCYGYELTQKINRYVALTEGALYPILRRLVKEDYCTTYLKESSEGPARKYYQITEAGQAHLADLLSEWKSFVKSVDLFMLEVDDE